MCPCVLCPLLELLQLFTVCQSVHTKYAITFFITENPLPAIATFGYFKINLLHFSAILAKLYISILHLLLLHFCTIIPTDQSGADEPLNNNNIIPTAYFAFIYWTNPPLSITRFFSNESYSIL